MYFKTYKTVWILAAFFCHVAGQSVYGQDFSTFGLTESPVALSMETNKLSYVVGEPVIVSLALTNKGNQPVNARWFRLPQSLNFRIRSEDGRRIFARTETPEGTVTIGLSTLSSKETLTTDFDIVIGDIINVSDQFPRTDGIVSTNIKDVTRYRLAPGRYTIVAVQGYALNGINTTATATASFEVQAPNEREKAALQLWMQRYLRPIDDVAKKRYIGAEYETYKQAIFAWWNEAKADFQKLNREYPETPYAPYALYYSGRLAQTQENWAEAISSYEQVLKDYPKFALQVDLLYCLADCYIHAGQKIKAQQNLDLLKQRFPSHFVLPTVEYFRPTDRLDDLQQRIKGN